jgi:hypothetical protein
VLQHLTSLKILSQLREIYYRNTGMLISFQDPGSGGRVFDYPRAQKSDNCKLIQASAEGLARCRECDRRGLAAARRKASYHIYKCHAGLVDVAIALEYKGSPLGSKYLLLNGFNLLGLNPFWQTIILGVILIYVVGQENILSGLRAAFGRGKVGKQA